MKILFTQQQYLHKCIPLLQVDFDDCKQISNNILLQMFI